ncbi:hypothetical protein GCM10027446_27440 [Angustibacter peucedani]
MPEQGPRVDPAALFAAVPSACALLDADLVVRDVTAAFLAVTGRTRAQVVGRPLVESFPGPDDDPHGPWEPVRASLQRALDTGVTDQLPLVRYDVEPDAGSGTFDERWWSITNIPVPDDEGRVAMVLNAVEDVTSVVHDRERRRRHREREVELIERAEQLQTDLAVREQEVRALSASEEQVGRRLQGLAFVALELAAAESVEELTDLVVVRGVAAMGCDGGGVAVRDDVDQVVRLTITDTRREGQRLRQEMPLTTHLPSVVSCIEPEPIYLGDRTEGLAWGPEMELVYATSGCDAWASLPLVADNRQLGSLTVSWVEPRTFTDGEKELLSAFAAQCAQALQRIKAREAEREATMSSRLLSESLQRSLLTDPVQPEHLQLVVRYQPAAREAYVGGDWYDAFQVGGGDTLIVIGDVAGHDRLATAAMAQVRGVLRGVAHSLDSTPAEVLGGLDRAMQDLGVDALATAVLARVECPDDDCAGSARRLLRWSNAGHPPPVLLHPDGRAELLRREPELLLGVQPSTARTDHVLELEPGATVLLYTDGLVERRGEPLGTGLEWLNHRVQSLAALPLDALLDALLAELPTDVEDDVALLAVRVESADDQDGVRRRTTSARTSGSAGSAGSASDALLGRPSDEVPVATSRRRQDVSLVLPPDVSAVRRARTFVRNHCRAAGVAAATCDTVALLTSETVTNAFIHGRSEARLRLVVRPDRVRVEVGDDNSRHPVRAERQDDALDGRGLDILDLVSTAWGVVDDVAGKIVWFEVAPEPAEA